MAIAQTPYSAFPGAATRLERIAGATTDLQHIVHQGLTYYDATFWVGANAVIRKKALDQIAETSYIGDWEIRAVHQGPHRHRGHRVHHRHGHQRLAPVQLPRAAQLQRHPAGFRHAVHPAAPVGQRRPADPVQAAPPVPDAPFPGEPNQVRRAVPALELHGLHLLELGKPADPARLPVQRDPDQPAARRDRPALLHGHGQRPALLRLQAPGRAAHLRLQPDPARRQPRRDPVVHRAGHHRVQGPLRPHPQGEGPDRGAAVPAHGTVRADRPRGIHAVSRVRQPPHGERLLRRAQRHPGLLRGQGVHRPAQLPDGHVDPRHLAALPVVRPPPRFLGRWRRPVEQPAPTDWRSVLQAGYAEPQYQSAGGPPRVRMASMAPPAPRPPPLPDGPPRRRLSLARVLVALVVVAGAGDGGYVGLKTRLLAPAAVTHQTWFAPYVDVTLTPTYQFQSTSADPARQSVLGFVVAAGKSNCTPSWGGAYPLAAANQQLTVGPASPSCSRTGHRPSCRSAARRTRAWMPPARRVADLTSAYRSVISAYHLTTIDLDIEGSALDDAAAGQRRAAAIAALEKADPKLGVWLTLPVEPTGLQDNAMSVIAAMLRGHVSIAGINVMTMDFSQAPAHGHHDGATGGARADRHRRAAREPLPGVRHSPALAADLAAARRDGDDRPERHPGRELHRRRRGHPGRLRRRDPPRPGFHVVDQPRQPVRLVLPRDRPAVQHLQRNGAIRPAVRPGLRPAAGRRSAYTRSQAQ